MKPLAIVLTLIVTCGATAQPPCRSGSVCHTPFVHHQQVIATPVVVVEKPVVAAAVIVEVPTFSFQVLTALQPAVATPVTAAPQASFSQQPAPRSELSDADMERLADKLAARLGNKSYAALPVAADDSPAQPAGDIAAIAAADLGQKCASCHGSTKTSGDFKLFHGNQIDPKKASDGSPVPWSLVAAKTRDHLMPPGARADHAKRIKPETQQYLDTLAGGN